MHRDAVELLGVHVLELPHDAYMIKLLPLQLGCAHKPAIAELAIEQLHEGFDPITTRQMFRKDVGGIDLAAHLPELYGSTTHLFSNP